MDLQKWISENLPNDELLWKGPMLKQVNWVRDRLVGLVSAGLDERIQVQVISTHMSKSCHLPVYQLLRRDLGLEIVLRSNFHDWKMSVISEDSINADFGGLFHTMSPIEPDYTGDPLCSVYFEGFPQDRIFGYLDEGVRKRWSAEIYGNESLWTAIWLILKNLGAIKPLVWITREAHMKKELEG